MTYGHPEGQGRCGREVPSTPSGAPCTGVGHPTRSTPREACRQGSACRVLWGYGRRDTAGYDTSCTLGTPAVRADGGATGSLCGLPVAPPSFIQSPRADEKLSSPALGYAITVSCYPQ